VPGANDLPLADDRSQFEPRQLPVPLARAHASCLRLAEFFEIPADRLATAEFEDLLAGELANPERFRSVESKIAQERERLQAARAPDEGKEIETATRKVEKDEVR
jgi:hypothetical protein